MEVIVEDAFVEAGEDVALTGKKDHFEVLQVAQQEHATMHHVEQALVH